jgi:outer membrane protein OmpA-like peptidoglycan-associated protein
MQTSQVLRTLLGLGQRPCACKNIRDLDEKRSFLSEKKLTCLSVPLSIQPKLVINRPDDQYEREADHVAEQVMRMPEPAVQRKAGCPFGRGPGCADDEEKIKKGTIRRKASENAGPSSDVPLIVHEALQSPGEPLDARTRAFFEPRFGYDFGHIRIHTDADLSASAIAAEAFTHGPDIFFARGFYAPHTSRTQLLLAHELTHTLQQQANRVPQTGSVASGHKEEQGKNRTGSLQMNSISPVNARLAGTPLLQRKVMVQEPPEYPKQVPPGVTYASIINEYVGRLCSGFTVDPSGEVRPPSDKFCAKAATTPTPESCKCLCDMTALPERDRSVGTWNIFMADNRWPYTDLMKRSVYVHSPYSGMEFGSWSTGPNAHRITEKNWLVLGHELCGHAWLYVREGKPGPEVVRDEGRVTHDPTVEIENKIAGEHEIPASEQRGLFESGPHHGESFGSVTIAQFPFGSPDFYSLPPAEQNKITIACDFMKGSSSIMADVIGHSDKPVKVASANERIAQQRAENVRNVLVGKGIRRDRFVAVTNKSDRECLQPGKQPQCRKVVIYMFKYGAASESHT